MKFLLHCIGLSLGFSFLTAAAQTESGEAFLLNLPSGYAYQKVEASESEADAGDQLLSRAQNAAKDELRVYRSQRIRVSNREIPRFVEAMKAVYLKRTGARSAEAKVVTLGERNWGVIELEIPGARPALKRIIIIVSVDGRPERVELDTKAAKWDALRQAAQHVLENSRVEAPIGIGGA
jgi:hypothetical protein